MAKAYLDAAVRHRRSMLTLNTVIASESCHDAGNGDRHRSIRREEIRGGLDSLARAVQTTPNRPRAGKAQSGAINNEA